MKPKLKRTLTSSHSLNEDINPNVQCLMSHTSNLDNIVDRTSRSLHKPNENLWYSLALQIQAVKRLIGMIALFERPRLTILKY